MCITNQEISIKNMNSSDRNELCKFIQYELFSSSTLNISSIPGELIMGKIHPRNVLHIGLTLVIIIRA
jgi:hypothetical protein